MPRLSPRTWEARRAHVLDSAFRCFARQGFHATTVDDIVAESGWSSSVVYRYVPTKDAFIAAAVQTSLAQLAAVVDDLVARDPVPTPREAVQAVVDLLDDERQARAYPLAALVIQSWSEALRTPALAAQAQTAWADARRSLVGLARRWKRLGWLPDDLSAADAATLIVLMSPGIVVDRTHLAGTSTDAVLRQLLLLDP